MIVREDYDNFIQVFDSLQGLYDELIVAVDDRKESDKVFDFLESKEKVKPFRQKWPGRFDLARQETLEKVSKDATFIGCCDSDEILISPTPLEIRDLLQKLNPPAANIYVKYLTNVGPHEAGQVYLRTKIWNSRYPRKWVGRIHEYPKCIDKYVEPVVLPLLFHHLKVDHKHYRSKLIIDTILFEIKEKNVTRWYPYLAQEYRGEKEYDKALECCSKYLQLSRTEDEHVKTALEEALLIFDKTKLESDKWLEFLSWLCPIIDQKETLLNSPIICEYLAMGSFYLKRIDIAKVFHDKAISLSDHSNVYKFIMRNSEYYV